MDKYNPRFKAWAGTCYAATHSLHSALGRYLAQQRKQNRAAVIQWEDHRLVIAAASMIRRWFTVALFVSVAGLDTDRAQYNRDLSH
ncbi:hypothetical protein ElyMa_005946700 [Elysia marginata]|uniref:Uncharacterized protein n=1 Tax=Elysia marginata TaxID=1093978 RepID=A0AAV4GBB9_9GAST|nr:hypothetical protein ElyMa_005946700 [Elysia marginata]